MPIGWPSGVVRPQVVDDRIEPGDHIVAQLGLHADVVGQRLFQRGAVLLRHLVEAGDRLKSLVTAL